MDAKDLLIVIPARGGSKGLPGKNAKNLGKYPLLKWTTDAIEQSGLQNYQCILSTDNEEIAAIGREINLLTPFLRPPEIATDTATAVDVLKHALDWCNNKMNIEARYLMWLQPTSPFRPPHIIMEAYTCLKDNSVDAVIGVKPIHRSLGTLFKSDEHQNMTPLDSHDRHITRRQDVQTLFTPNGAMYALSTETLSEQGTLFPDNNRGIELNQIQSHDIDDLTDWAIATSYVNSGLTWRSEC